MSQVDNGFLLDSTILFQWLALHGILLHSDLTGWKWKVLRFTAALEWWEPFPLCVFSSVHLWARGYFRRTQTINRCGTGWEHETIHCFSHWGFRNMTFVSLSFQHCNNLSISIIYAILSPRWMLFKMKHIDFVYLSRVYCFPGAAKRLQFLLSKKNINVAFVLVARETQIESE